MYNRSHKPEGVCPDCKGTGLQNRIVGATSGSWPCARCDGTGIIGHTGYTLIAVIVSALACVAIAALVLQ